MHFLYSSRATNCLFPLTWLSRTSPSSDGDSAKIRSNLTPKRSSSATGSISGSQNPPPLFTMTAYSQRRSQWPRGLRRGWAAARLLGLGVRNPQGVCMSASYKCCMLSGRGLCDRPIPHPEEFYRVYVTEYDRVQQLPSTPTVSR